MIRSAALQKDNLSLDNEFHRSRMDGRSGAWQLEPSPKRAA
jgi:hypothetical protein